MMIVVVVHRGKRASMDSNFLDSSQHRLEFIAIIVASTARFRPRRADMPEAVVGQHRRIGVACSMRMRRARRGITSLLWHEPPCYQSSSSAKWPCASLPRRESSERQKFEFYCLFQLACFRPTIYRLRLSSVSFPQPISRAFSAARQALRKRPDPRIFNANNRLIMPF